MIKKTSYLIYLDANNSYGWTMIQKLSVNDFKSVEYLPQFNENFIKHYDENSDRGYFLKVDVEYPKNVFNFHKDVPFLPERKKVFGLHEYLLSLLERKKLEKAEKLVCCREDKEKHVVHIRALKQALNHGLKLKHVHRVIQFNQKAWLKPYTDMNARLRKEAKNKFEKDFF